MYLRDNVRIGTLFSGIGAAEHALERLGIPNEIVFACDTDPFVKKSYLTNHQIDEDRWFTDVREFNATPYMGKVDLIVGGSPCQSFSIMGKRGGLDDTRGTLFYEFARVIKECSPKSFIFENVKGLFTHDNGETWRIIQDVFHDLGYDIHHTVINSKDHGVPQSRPRIFVVGFKDPRPGFKFPDKVPLEFTMQDFLEDYTDSRYYDPEKGTKSLYQKELLFEVKEVPEKYYLSDKLRDYVLSTGTKSFKVTPKTDLPVARCLLQTMHKMHRAGIDNYVTHKGRIRKLTPRECLRLMGFQDSFKIVVSDTQIYRQAGNSIVVDVLMGVISHMNI